MSMVDKEESLMNMDKGDEDKGKEIMHFQTAKIKGKENIT
jgi:hypothetical protein